MSEITNNLSTTNQLYNSYDTSKLLLGFNSFTEADHTSSGGTDFVQGEIVGQIASSGKIAKLDSGATDGSQYPFGVVLIDQTVEDGETETIKLVNKGKVAQEKIVFQGSDDLTTTVGPADNLRTYKALLNDLGIELEAGTELTEFDNV